MTNQVNASEINNERHLSFENSEKQNTNFCRYRLFAIALTSAAVVAVGEVCKKYV